MTCPGPAHWRRRRSSSVYAGVLLTWINQCLGTQERVSIHISYRAFIQRLRPEVHNCRNFINANPHAHAHALNKRINLSASLRHPITFQYRDVHYQSNIQTFNQAPAPATSAAKPAAAVLIGAAAPVEATTLFVELVVKATRLLDDVFNCTTVEGAL